MCGISVVLDWTPREDILDLVGRMHAPILHRGPDGEGFLAAGTRIVRGEELSELVADKSTRVAAAFRRLNILDLTDAAAQPMVSPSRPIAVLFNGEIYNYRELRDELKQSGRQFRSTGDTEVVLASYERWGQECFQRFDGMWAITFIDLERRSVIVSRDRFGIKPLFWAEYGGRLLFASEAKQIVAATGSARANRPLIGMFLRGLRCPALDETFFEGVRSVPAATWCEIPIDSQSLPALNFRRYWDLGAVNDRGPVPDYVEAVETFESLLRRSVAAHRIADVKVGSLLSGGIDSSTLAVMLSEFDDEGGRQFPTFSFGFREREPDVCELRYVDAIVRERGLVNHETTFDAAWVRQNAERVTYALEEPLLGIPAVAQFRVFELARAHGATVLFDGQGADELFAGYPYHQRIFLADRWRRRRFGAFVRELRNMKRRDGGSALSFFVRDMVLPSVVSRLRGRSNSSEPSFLNPECVGRTDNEYREALSDRGSNHSLVNQQIHFDVRWGNAKVILGFGDRAGMAHSLEARVPYFDHKLVEFAMTLPDDYKIGGGDRKRILRDVARRRLPPVITERADKVGFAVPMAKWMGEGLGESIRGVISDARLESATCLLRNPLRDFVDHYHPERPTDARAAWRLFALATWATAFRADL